MIRPSPRALLAGVLPLFVACADQSVSPDVGPSSLDVRAYVDVDGSGAFGGGDQPIAGASIELAGATLTVSATTDAEGLASFDGLAPGSYELAYAGAVPEGATLAGATRPVVVAATLRQELESEFRFVYFPGGIDGVLFRDENDDGVYGEGDTPAPGIPVAAYAGEAAGDEAVAETVTDADGAFSFAGLRPGTYTLVFSPFPTMTLVGGASQTVMVGAEVATAVPVTFEGDLLTPIGDARGFALDGDEVVVAVEGVVTWQPSFNDDLFIEDASGGIMVFGGPVDVSAMGLEPGDTVIAVGTTSLYFGEPQLVDVSAVLLRGSGPAPSGAPTTADEVNAGAVQHRLVTIAGATVVRDSVLSFGNQYVTLVDPAGNEFAVYGDSRTGVEADVWTEGGIYDVTGVAAFDNRYAYPHRIEVRGPGDVVPGEAPLTVAEVHAAEAGVEVSVAGVVTWRPAFGAELWIQDATGGLQIFGGAVDLAGLALTPGDVVLVTGTTEDRFGERQLTSLTYLVRIAEGEAPEPEDVAPGDVALERAHELVRIAAATVLSVDDGFNAFGNQLVTLKVGGEEFGVYVDSRVGVFTEDWTVGGVYDVAGVINYDNRYGPHEYRIWVRGPADVVAN